MRLSSRLAPVLAALAAVSSSLLPSTAQAGFLWEHDCVNNGCLQLTNHIATTSVPYSTGDKVVMATTAVGNSRVITFCKDGVITHARKSNGSLITVTSGNALTADLSVCGTSNPNNLEVLAHDAGSRSCGGTTIRPIVQNGFDLAISTGSTPSGNDPVNDDYVKAHTGINGATYLCGGNGRQHLDAADAAFPLLWGFGSNDFLTTSEFEGGWLFGGEANDTLIGDTSATSLCYGEVGLDVCLGCTHAFECELFR